MTTRKYSSRSQQTTLTSAVTSGAVVLPVVSATTLLGGATVSTGQTFTVVIDPDTALEEIVEVTVVSSNNLTVTRAVDMAGATAQDHSSGAVIRHMIIGRDLREANTHIEATGSYNDGTGAHDLHGLGATSGVVVGTDAIQTLTNKTLVSPTLTGLFENDASIVFEGATADAYETTLTVVDPTADRTITLPNATGTVVLKDTVDTLTNKTLTSPTISGSPVITGLSSAGMSASSAAPKDYVDSILGSATAASTSATSAAVSATAAATSATSAAASATVSAASAITAGNQATAATTSATSAAASATAAATSAASAATSATSAAVSATTAAASVASILTAATNASNSASAAATSATSAAALATAAATSAASAATSASSILGAVTASAASATAAATSATSAAASATAAATSATNAAASATTAAASVASIATYASNALTSQNAAATSATSASASATAAATSATSAAASATAAATSATSAATSASSSATSFTSVDQKYLGAKASAPTLNNQGGALATGALYWNTSNNTMYVYTGSAWTASTANATIVTYKYTASGGETSKSGADDNGLTLSYVVGYEQVYINGVLQVRNSDYTASTGSSITGLTALVAGDILSVLAFSQFSVADTYTQAQANAAFIAKTLTTTKGDIITATAASTPARLPVGSDTQILVADSTAATGLKWATAAGGGKVLQVVYAATTTSTNIASTSLTSTTLTASITPSSTSSKVLIIANNNIYNDTAGRGAAAAITRGATTLIHQNDTNNAGTFNLSDSRGSATIPIQYLDSPSTTSSITYTIKATSIGAGNVTFQNGGSPSNILLFEIGA